MQKEAAMIQNELITVLFWDDMAQYMCFEKSLYADYFPATNTAPLNTPAPEAYSKKLRQYWVDKIQTKAEFVRRIHNYAASQDTLRWEDQSTPHCETLRQDNILGALKNGGYKNGERRYQLYKEMASAWAFHLKDYAAAVHGAQNDAMILELSVGAGLGTCAVVETLLPANHMYGVDIDFECARNVDGIAAYFNVSDRVCGLGANFWFLPFPDNVFDCVCAHYGLDESREVQAVLGEAARVMKPGGRLVALVRKNPYARQKFILDMFGIAQGESRELLQKARLYSGVEDLAALAAQHGLLLTSQKIYEPDTGHHRALCVFTKVEAGNG